jgi:hypothetical protein
MHNECKGNVPRRWKHVDSTRCLMPIVTSTSFDSAGAPICFSARLPLEFALI